MFQIIEIKYFVIQIVKIKILYLPKFSYLKYFSLYLFKQDRTLNSILNI